ncbi:MAG: 30S ribosomal protein S9 [Thermoplasmata archaeon]|jgi:small subunit ribosomal protein S9|nr:30S ribosomal protein S9 [Euryarchaeota archaeon]MVT14689.1 30S ribosomal protein S9 [Euryarchaeota archaeon]MVT35929.1 30S ribosomal protein S9 [Euryarchaeota archaeon]
MKVIVASGKRKTAVARAVAREGNGRIRINKIPLEIYKPELLRMMIMEPILLIGEKAKQVDIDVNVKGGGIVGQAEASRTAIARAINQFFNDSSIEKIFKEYDRTLIVNDVRRKLPKLPMGRGARAKRQKSYR